jgi:hypothetical protein
MSDRVTIFDTTLRDGEQSCGCSMTVAEKLRMAGKLVDLGVDVMEAGFPAASPGDFEAVFPIAREIEGPTVCALARANRQDIDRVTEALRPAERRRCHVFLATSPIHREFKLGLSPSQVVQRAVEGVRHARESFDDVEYSAEDAARTEPDFLCEVVERCIEACGIGFLFAPKLHPAFKAVAGIRRELGIRSIFNLLGPLANPAFATHQLVGVYDGSLTAVMAMVLHNLGAKRAFVVHGSDGLDELTTTGVSTVSELRGGRVHTYTVHPGDFGLPSNRPEELRGGDASYNADLTLRLLHGEALPQRGIVLLNAAAAIAAGTADEGIADCLALAQEALDGGQALAKLEHLREFTRQWSPTS